MNRKIGVIAGVAAVGLLGYMSSLLVAQDNKGAKTGATPPSRPKTAIAVFNLSFVMENCEHAKTFIAESKADAKSLQAQIEPMLKKFEELRKKIAETPQEKRDMYADQYKKMEREIKDFEEMGKEQIKKKSDQQIKILYKEIEDAAVRLAKYRSIDLVMHYNDFVGDLKDQPANIRQKFINASLFPVYSSPGVDVTDDVLAILNRKANTAAKPTGN